MASMKGAHPRILCLAPCMLIPSTFVHMVKEYDLLRYHDCDTAANHHKFLHRYKTEICMDF